MNTWRSIIILRKRGGGIEIFNIENMIVPFKVVVDEIIPPNISQPNII